MRKKDQAAFVVVAVVTFVVVAVVLTAVIPESAEMLTFPYESFVEPLFSSFPSL